MLKALCSIILLLAVNTGIENQLKAQGRAGDIDSLLQVAHQRGFFNGNVLVAEKGKIVYRNQIGFADGSREKRLSPDLRFGIGSISKEFDGMAIMLLRERGELSLENKLSEYFPQLPSWAKTITVRQLLQYTSGLPSADYQKVRTDAQNWEFLMEVDSLLFEPGTDYGYNNTNVFLRKRIIEKVTGQSYSDFITGNLLKPCGLRNPVIDPTKSTPLVARSFDNHFVEDDFDTYMSGWVYLSDTDLYRWTQCLHSGELIDRAALYELFESYSATSQSPLGRGFFDAGKLTFQYHHGQSDNFEASLYFNPQDQFTILLLTNNRNSNVGDLTTAIDAILRGEPFEIPAKSIEMTLRTEIWYNGFQKGMDVLELIRKNEREIYDFENEESELLNTGEYLLEKGRSREGLKMLDYTVGRFPKSWKAHHALGKAYLNREEPGRALPHLRRALYLNPDNDHIRMDYKLAIRKN